jgi:hypothetical protein
MNNLTNGILSVVTAAVEEYSLHIANKYNIPVSELEGYWNEVCGDLTISVKTNSATKKKTIKKITTSSSEEIRHCPYIFVKGKDKKGTVCGAKVRIEGRTYCSRHKSKEGTLQKEPKGTLLPKARKNVTPKKITLRMHRSLKVLWHPDSKLVFKNRIVVSRIEDGDIRSLREEDIEECKKWRFKYEIKEEEEEKEEICDKLQERLKNLQIEEENSTLENKDIEEVLNDITEDGEVEEIEEFSDISEEED